MTGVAPEAIAPVASPVDADDADGQPIAEVHSHRSALILLALLAVIWGVHWVIVKVGLGYVPPITYAASRVAIALVLMTALLRRAGPAAAPGPREPLDHPVDRRRPGRGRRRAPEPRPPGRRRRALVGARVHDAAVGRGDPGDRLPDPAQRPRADRAGPRARRPGPAAEPVLDRLEQARRARRGARAAAQRGPVGGRHDPHPPPSLDAVAARPAAVAAAGGADPAGDPGGRRRARRGHPLGAGDAPVPAVQRRARHGVRRLGDAGDHPLARLAGVGDRLPRDPGGRAASPAGCSSARRSGRSTCWGSRSSSAASASRNWSRSGRRYRCPPWPRGGRLGGSGGSGGSTARAGGGGRGRPRPRDAGAGGGTRRGPPAGRQAAAGGRPGTVADGDRAGARGPAATARRGPRHRPLPPRRHRRRQGPGARRHRRPHQAPLRPRARPRARRHRPPGRGRRPAHRAAPGRRVRGARPGHQRLADARTTRGCRCSGGSTSRATPTSTPRPRGTRPPAIRAWWSRSSTPGMQLNHGDLAGNLWTNPGEIAGNGIDDDDDGYVDDVHGWDFVGDDNLPNDDFGHGTHVAGTLAAVGNNGIGVVGVAYSSRIMPLRVLDGSGQGYVSDAVRAIDYATRHGVRSLEQQLGLHGRRLPGPVRRDPGRGRRGPAGRDRGRQLVGRHRRDPGLPGGLRPAQHHLGRGDHAGRPPRGVLELRPGRRRRRGAGRAHPEHAAGRLRVRRRHVDGQPARRRRGRAAAGGAPDRGRSRRSATASSPPSARSRASRARSRPAAWSTPRRPSPRRPTSPRSSRSPSPRPAPRCCAASRSRSRRRRSTRSRAASPRRSRGTRAAWARSGRAPRSAGATSSRGRT